MTFKLFYDEILLQCCEHKIAKNKLTRLTCKLNILITFMQSKCEVNYHWPTIAFPRQFNSTNYLECHAEHVSGAERAYLPLLRSSPFCCTPLHAPAIFSKAAHRSAPAIFDPLRSGEVTKLLLVLIIGYQYRQSANGY